MKKTALKRMLAASVVAGAVVAAAPGWALRLASAPDRAPRTNTPAADTLSLRAAINDALHNNVQALLASARRDAAAGDRVEARAAFLPHLSVDASQSRQSNNLAAQGFDFQLPAGLPGGQAPFPSGVITFNRFDARARLRQNLFDYSAWQRYQGAKVGERIADDQLAVAREQVAAQAALDYVSALSARAAVTAAEADRTLAARLVKLAQDQEHVGLATGVDVNRAKTRLASSRARLAQQRTRRARANIVLARTTGLTLGTPLHLSDDLAYTPVALGPDTADVSHALSKRPEIKLAAHQIQQRAKQLAAARGERLPTLSLSAAYGESGNTYHDNVEDTYSFGAQIELPIFNGGATSGRIDSAASRLDQQRIRYRDTRNQVEQDVRVARRTLKTLSQRVRSARSALALAKRELALSRDRFANGVGDNIEVVDAQASLADARNTRVNALAEYTRARINMAAALGRAEQFRLYNGATP